MGFVHSHDPNAVYVDRYVQNHPQVAPYVTIAATAACTFITRRSRRGRLCSSRRFLLHGGDGWERLRCPQGGRHHVCYGVCI